MSFQGPPTPGTRRVVYPPQFVVNVAVVHHVERPAVRRDALTGHVRPEGNVAFFETADPGDSSGRLSSTMPSPSHCPPRRASPP